MLPIKQAIQLIADNVQRGGTEKISLADSVGRILAVDVKSDVDSPPHNKSIMDGFAVRAEDVEPVSYTHLTLPTILLV